MSGYWAVEGRKLLLNWSPSDSDTVTIKAVIRVPAQPEESDLIFAGREAEGRYCYDSLRLRFLAFVAELMANKAQTGDEITGWLLRKAAKMQEYHGQDGTGGALAEARSNILTAKYGTHGKIRRTFP